MECSRIPPAQTWDAVPAAELQKYRNHVQQCNLCRKRVFLEAPDQFLFELSERQLPEEFWFGFWSSLQNKLFYPSSPPVRATRFVRWAAVMILGTLLVLYSHSFDEPPKAVRIQKPQKYYPVLEDIQDPSTIYYLLDPSENAKIVFIFNPEMEL